MKVSKTRLKQMGLRNHTQFKVLRQLVKLWENFVGFDKKRKPYIVIKNSHIHEIFYYSPKTVENYFNDLEEAGYINFVHFKPRGYSKKDSEYCVTVFRKASQAVHKENSLQKMIKSKQDKIRMEYEDFPV